MRKSFYSLIGIVTEKMGKGMCKDTNRIITAPVKNEPIPKSYASASLLTELMVGKYVDHLPFYRQIQMFKRIGISL
ncbi:IS66 family transposase, partial [Phocaeicola barnesiae]|uniref:IS66 family transposase n=1 Tax=Phocaeicola barnesiae TaxID=376804 RepID=UPI003DA93B2A